MWIYVMLGLASGNRIRFSGKLGSKVVMIRSILNAQVVRADLRKKFERRSNCTKNHDNGVD